MTLGEVKELNTAPFDWCYDCARIACKNSKQKMFAWIVCFLMKTGRCSYRFTNQLYKSNCQLTFIVDLSVVLNENEAILDELYKKKNWMFLSELIYNHTIHNLQVSKETSRALLKPKIKIKDSKVFVMYNC